MTGKIKPVPPMPWPPPEPQPKPSEDALYDDINWMAFSHEQLYDMALKGVDVAGANAVAAKWAKLGQSLQEIADELAKALAASVDAWEGAAANQARGSIAALSDWSREAGQTATDVAGLVSVEANNAEIARRSMPEPVADQLKPIPIPADSTAPMSAAFESAASIVQDPHGPSTKQHAAHQEAARVMQQFQSASRDVYGTVPQFSPPITRGTYKAPDPTPQPPEPPPRLPQPPPPVPPVPVPPVPPPSPGPAPGPGPVGGSGGAGPVNPIGAGSNPVSPGTPVQPGEPAAPRPGPGAGSGVATPPHEETRPAAARGAGAASGGGAGGGMGMAPGVAGSGKDEDLERKSPKYLEGDPDLFRIRDRMAPPVIGEDDNGA